MIMLISRHEVAFGSTERIEISSAFESIYRFVYARSDHRLNYATFIVSFSGNVYFSVGAFDVITSC